MNEVKKRHNKCSFINWQEFLILGLLKIIENIFVLFIFIYAMTRHFYKDADQIYMRGWGSLQL
jgi:hypothetical protein